MNDKGRCGAAVLLPQRRGPVPDNGDGHRASFLRRQLDQEALAIRADRELIASLIGIQPGIEERPRGS